MHLPVADSSHIVQRSSVALNLGSITAPRPADYSVRNAPQPESEPDASDPARRILNIIVAVALLVASAPVMLAIAILIKLTSRGPVFYTQTRVGVDRRQSAIPPLGCRRLVDYGGRLFTIYKFRTMSAHGGPVLQIWARQDDPRITWIGGFLRKYRLDELPQLINVIKGDMNIVGPRPEQPAIVLDLKEQVDSYTTRQRVLPGITGWAQVNQSYDRCIEDVKRKVQLDLEYIQRRSVWKDLKIMIFTVPVMVFRKGGW